MRVIVVGAGIAGLGAAFKLREEGHEVVLLEKDTEPGGRCRSVHWNGIWAVTGAFDMMAAARHPYIPLGEKAKLLAALPRMAKQMLKSDARDITSARALDDVNACEYFRRYSPTFVDYFLEPCMSMFCGYGEDDYSLGWAAWSSVGRLSWAGSTMWSFKERGAGRLTWALGNHLAADPGATHRLGQQVQRVEVNANGVRVITEADGRSDAMMGDAVVMAVPGHQVAPLMPGLDAARRAYFDGYITQLKRFRDLGPLPRVAFCGDYLTNSTVGQSHWSGLEAARELMQARV